MSGKAATRKKSCGKHRDDAGKRRRRRFRTLADGGRREGHHGAGTAEGAAAEADALSAARRNFSGTS